MSSKTQNRQSFIILSLILIFSSPFLMSWFLLNHTEYANGGDTANNGELIQPPRPLADISLADPVDSDGEDRLNGKWSLAYLTDDVCGEECEQNLYKMRQLRLAIGKNSHRVQRVLVVSGPSLDVLSAAQLHKYRGQLIADIQDFEPGTSFAPSSTEAVPEGRLYIIDPLGNLMMSYPPEIEPAGIIKDLARLIKYSRIG